MRTCCRTLLLLALASTAQAYVMFQDMTCQDSMDVGGEVYGKVIGNDSAATIHVMNRGYVIHCGATLYPWEIYNLSISVKRPFVAAIDGCRGWFSLPLDMNDCNERTHVAISEMRVPIPDMSVNSGLFSKCLLRFIYQTEEQEYNAGSACEYTVVSWPDPKSEAGKYRFPGYDPEAGKDPYWFPEYNFSKDDESLPVDDEVDDEL